MPSLRQRVNRGYKGRLLSSSIDAYVLALETINRLSVKYRIETFAFLICNSWELLMKAKVIEDAGTSRAAFNPKRRGQPRTSLSLDQCLDRLFQNTADPTRRNLEYVSELRNQSTHFVISAVPQDILGLFQACVLNYHRQLGYWFGLALSDRISVGMMTIVFDISPESFDLKSVALRRQLGAETADYLLDCQSRMRQESAELRGSAEFAIDITYSLALVTKPGKADIVLTSGPTGDPMRYLEVPKDPAKTHPFRQTDVISAVNKRFTSGQRFNNYDVKCISDRYGVRHRPEYLYKGRFPQSPTQYSQAYIDWIVEECNKDPDFLSRCRQHQMKLRSKDHHADRQ